MRNQVQLITYVDRLGGTLRGLHDLLRGPLRGLFGGVHLLPFFVPIDGADAGFDPTDHTAVDPRLGTWADVTTLTRTVDVMADVIVNHVSTSSPWFRDYLAHGARSPSAGMFLTFDRVFPGGATEADLLRLYRPRPGLPLTDVSLGDRTRRILWTTFTPQQVDLDITHPAAERYLQSVLDRFAAAGIGIVRLDAVGYAVKTAGTSCFMTPETYAFIDVLRSWAKARGLEVLVEIHSHYEQQIAIAEHVDWVYDFGLSPLVLHGLYTGDAGPLRRWLSIRPRNAITVLDTHDGIGVHDIGRDVTNPQRRGLLGEPEIDALVEQIHERTGGDSRLATGTAAANVDLYQVNSTYYGALGEDDGAYLLARALQLFTPGIPQIYYVGLLAGGNDLELLATTGVGRDINRHHYRRDEVEQALERPVVRRLRALLHLRNRHPAFMGSWALAGEGRSDVMMRWRDGEHEATLRADLAAGTFALDCTDGSGRRAVRTLDELPVP